MKVVVKTVCVNWLHIDRVGAGELLDVGNILTSPDLPRVVGLPARR
jgi:hypothetical protein